MKTIMTILSLMFAADAACAQVLSKSRLFDTEQGLDVSYKMGFIDGMIKRPPDGTTPDQEFQFSGMPLQFALNHEMSPLFSMFYELELVLDFANSMVTRKGIGSGICYHLLGGSRRAILERYDEYTLTSKNRYNLSGCGKGSFLFYSASNKEDLAERVTGSLIEAQAGLQYRHDLGTNFSMGLEIFRSFYTIPASVERIETKSFIAALFARTYI